MTEHTCELCGEPVLTNWYQTVDGVYLCEECASEIPYDDLIEREDDVNIDDYF